MKANFLQEDNGNWSLVRLITLLVVAVDSFGFIMMIIKIFYLQPNTVDVFSIINNTVALTGHNVVQPDYSFIVLIGGIITAIYTSVFALKWLSKSTEEKVVTPVEDCKPENK